MVTLADNGQGHVYCIILFRTWEIDAIDVPLGKYHPLESINVFELGSGGKVFHGFSRC